MKIKWTQLPPGNGHRGVRLEAVLVDGHLHGRETVITRLGTIERRFLQVNILTTREFHQGLFWKKVDRCLSGLDLAPDAKAEIEAQICEKVPRPSQDWAMWAVTCIPRFDR